MKDIDLLSSLSSLYREKFGEGPENVVRLAGAGSDRIYYRLAGNGHSAIGVSADSLKDAEAFLALTPVLRRSGVNAPEIYGVAPNDPRIYLQEDLGESQLLPVLVKRDEKGELTEEAWHLAKESLAQLARFQTIRYDEWKDAVEYSSFSRRQALWDLNYFKYEFLKPVGVDFDEELLEDDFENLVQQLVAVSGGCSGLMYRDFQSRNVMIKDGEPFLIDYQGARRGPSIYDAVSFLWQAKAGFRDEERMELLDYYQGCYLSYRPSANALHASAWLFVAFRTLQVLGAYGFRGLVEGKAHFIESLPPALATLKSLLDKGLFSGFPELEKACRNAISSPRLRDLPSPDEKGGPLNIDVYSFSYKKGYPKDLSGNGGGFMFDCRGMHNPGRYAEYKSLTGLDAPVRDFLKERGEADGFVKKALEIVIPSVETYLRRGFTRLQIGFGCTGGQHRSVYCAQEVGEALRKNYPAANIRIIHREQEGGKR